jgi:hypothetical protein
MAILASISVPKRTAIDFIGNVPRGLLMDPRHVAKAALAEAFGEGGLRPWRLVSAEPPFLSISGWVSPSLSRAEFDEGCRKLGAAVHLDVHEPKRGDTVALTIDAAPVSNQRVEDPVSGRRRTVSVDVARGRNPSEAYEEWIRRRIEAPRSGIEIAGAIRIRSAAPTQGIYKNAEGRLLQARVARVVATIPVRVVDPGNYQEFIRQGVGRLRHVGYGSLIPEGLVHGH